MLLDIDIPFAHELRVDTAWNGKPKTRWIDNVAPGTAEAERQRHLQVVSRKTKRLRRMQSQNAVQRAIHDVCEVLGLTNAA